VSPRWAAMALSCCLTACSGRPTRPPGPPPEYERPVLAAWDAGSRAETEDPFEAAAQGDWVEEPITELEQPVADAGPSDADAAAADAQAQTESETDAAGLGAAEIR
jgi:hypothetical protein